MTHPLLIATFLSALLPSVETADTARNILLQEVEIVTPIKDQTSLRTAPQSSTIIGKAQLEDHQVTNIKSASQLVPNLFIPDYGSRLTSAIYIRGIGSRINTPAVGLYVDDIPYVDKSAFDFNFQDVQRVDVLRGPQGTMYGRNTMGGLIRVYTKDPFRHQGTDAGISLGSIENRLRTALTHNHRVSEKFAFTAGGYYEKSDGFYRHSLTTNKVDGQKAAGGRLRGIYRPTQRLSLDLQAGYDYTDEGGYPYYYTGTTSGEEQYPNLVGTISNNRPHTYRRSMMTAGLNVGYQAPTWQMNAITSYQWISDRMFMDQDFLQTDVFSLEQRQRIHNLTEEIVFKDRTTGPWHWISGVNLMYQSLNTNAPVMFYEGGVSELIEKNTNQTFDQLRAKYPRMPQMQLVVEDQKFEVLSDMDTPTLSAALFHQSSYTLGRLELTAGLRLAYDHTRIDYTSGTCMLYDFKLNLWGMPLDYPHLVCDPHLEGSLRDDYLQVLPKASAKYTLPNDLGSLYASICKGYRSGGYNVQMMSDLLQSSMRGHMMHGINLASDHVMEQYIDLATLAAPVDPSTITYRPEYSWNYELGTHLTLLDHTLLIDASAFYIRTYDQQIARFTPSGLGRMMVNAGRSRSLGAELSILWSPNPHWTLSGSYGYTHATFTRYDDSNGSTKGADYSGHYVPFVPAHTMNVDAAYSWQFKDHTLQKITLGTNLSGAGTIYWTEANEPWARQDFYLTLGARLRFDLKAVSLTLWGKNLTQTRYNTFYFESTSHGFEQHGKPLHLGLDLKVHF